MKMKLNLLSLLILNFFDGEGGGGGDVASPDVVDSSSTETSTAESTAGDVTAVEDAKEAAEDDPLKDIPTLEELQQQAEQKVPYAAGLARVRAAYESVAPLKSWQEVATTIGDPTIAKDYHELMGSLRSPVEGQPDQTTTRPFLDKLESMSPGVSNEIFFDLLNYQIPDENGRTDTMVRHMYRSHGLDPDRLEDYRNIDTIRASGVVTTDDLAGIPERFHSAFRALSSAQRDDILLQRQQDAFGKTVYSPATLDYLQDKAEALEARTWREKDEQAKAQQAQQQQQAFEQQLEEQVIQDLTSEAQSIRDSILENLSSQVTFSSDPVQDKLAKAGIMALVSQVQSPYPYQQQYALEVLKAAGIEPNGFGELLNRFEEREAAAVRFTAMGDQLQARRAKSEATIAKQQILARANDYTLRLAKANGERVAQTASQQNGQLAAATARYVPSGSQTQQGSQNPYENNPHPVGSQEYFAYNRKLDKEFKLTGASMFGS